MLVTWFLLFSVIALQLDRPAHLVHESSRARPARSSELAQLRSAFDSDRYQIRQMVERSQKSKECGFFEAKLILS